MGAADAYGDTVVFHDLTHKLPSGETGDVPLLDGDVLRVVGMDGAGEDCTVNILWNVLSPLSDVDGDAL